MLKKVILINPENSGRGIKKHKGPRAIKLLKPPFGLLTVASIFLKNGVEVSWIDADLLRNDPKQVYQLIKDNADADLIALGGLHTAYASIKNIYEFLRTSRLNIPAILGGRIAQTLDYLLWEKIPNLNMICTQEGEYVVDSLCKYYPDIERIIGIEYRKDGRIVKNPSAPIIKTLDEAPPLPWHLLDKAYFRQSTGNILTGRGCPYSCNFCRIKPDKYRTGSISRAIDEIKNLVSTYHLRTIVVMDEYFLQNKKRVDKFCEGVSKLNIKWRCTSRADGIRENDYDLLKKMSASGCKEILMGIESASQKILNNMNKRVEVKTIENAVNLIRKAGIRVRAGFIFGYPGETWETAMETVDWRIKMDMRWRHYFATPYPGSVLYNEFKKRYRLTLDQEEQWIINSPSLKDLQVNLTELSMEELKQLNNACIEKLIGKHYKLRKFSNKLKRIYNIFNQKFCHK